METRNNYNFFFYTNEPLVLVSNGKIWCHKPEKIHNPSNFIIPILENVTFDKNNLNSYYRICTDYPNDLFSLINEFKSNNTPMKKNSLKKNISLLMKIIE